MTHPLHELEIREPLVRALLAEQHPDLVDLPLTHAAQGWDNVTFRLGEHLAVRLPARAPAAPLVEHEQRWLPSLARTLPVPVPAPVRLGRPGAGFPWAWSVVPWLAGRPNGSPATAMAASSLSSRPERTTSPAPRMRWPKPSPRRSSAGRRTACPPIPMPGC